MLVTGRYVPVAGWYEWWDRWDAADGGFDGDPTRRGGASATGWSFPHAWYVFSRSAGILAGMVMVGSSGSCTGSIVTFPKAPGTRRDCGETIVVGWTKVMVGCVVAGRDWVERVRPISALIRSGPVAWASRATLKGCNLLGARLCCDIALGI